VHCILYVQIHEVKDLEDDCGWLVISVRILCTDLWLLLWSDADMIAKMLPIEPLAKVIIINCHFSMVSKKSPVAAHVVRRLKGEVHILCFAVGQVDRLTRQAASAH
jgi:hypothetical protein